MPIPSPTVATTDSRGYSYVSVSKSWADLCQNLPCFRALSWPGYATRVDEVTINGQAVVIQLWKGWCPKFLGEIPGALGGANFPGGVGAEVGIYRRIPRKAKPTSLPFLPRPIEKLVINLIESLSANELWWPAPELNPQIQFRLINPVTKKIFFEGAPPVTNQYWLCKWMNDSSYSKYQADQGKRWRWLPAWVPFNSNTPAASWDYTMDYTINGQAAMGRNGRPVKAWVGHR